MVNKFHNLIDFRSRSALSRHFYFDSYELPNILFTNSFRPENSLHIECINDKIKILGKEISVPSIKEIQEIELEEKVIYSENLVILPGLSTLEKKPRDMVKRILSTREEIGYKKILYAPNIARPNLLPVLHYLGIDVLDDLKCQFKNHCSEELWSMELFVKKALEKNELRVLVESIPDPLSKTLLRISDADYYDQMEIFFPVTGNFLNASHFESLFRPDIQRWIRRITEIYEKPECERFALLLPCSATKPYSKSRSHRFYRSILEQSKKHLHEVIVTSPLGIVPRELEFTFPAKNYDIPVTGYWYEDEKKMLIQALEKYLSRNKYEKIFAYLPDDLYFLQPYLEKINITYVIGNLRDEKNVRKLLDNLGSIKQTNISKNQFLLDSLNSISKFQFNEKFPLKDKKVRKRFDEILVYDGNEQYLYFSPINGNLHLYKKSAQYLLEKNKHVVEIDNFVPKGSVFVAGIKNASPDIREGDELVIHQNGKLIGTGAALMTFRDMLDQDRGEAIKIRHTFIS